MRTTDMADELFRGPETELPAGVRLATAKRGGVTVTRVEITREGLARPRGRYVTLEMPSVSVLDERDTDVIETGAAELRALLPPEGPVLVLGIGNRRVTADALGPRTAQKILVTMGPQHTLPVRGIRPVAALAPGVSGDTGLTLRQLAAAMVDAVRPAALICVDSLCSAEAARLGRTIQFSDTGLHPADARHARHLDAAALGVPVIAAGIPTLMDADEGGRPGAHAPCAGQRHRSRVGAAGGHPEPGPAAPPQRGAVVLADGLTAYKIRTGFREGGISHAQPHTAAPAAAGPLGCFSGSRRPVSGAVCAGPQRRSDLGGGGGGTLPGGADGFVVGGSGTCKARHPTRSRSPPPKSRPRPLPRRCRKPCRR